VLFRSVERFSLFCHFEGAMILASRIFVLLFLLPSFVDGRAENLNNLMNDMERMVRKLGEAIKEVYLDRNCTETLARCKGGNFDWFETVLPNLTCYDSKQFSEKCSIACNGKPLEGKPLDYTVSNVVLNSVTQKEGGQWYPQIIDSVCYTMALDHYFRNQREDLLGYNKTYGIEPPPIFFGSHEGVFRIYPARYITSDWATRFDARTRPWYVAATTFVPKNIVLVLDTSGSLRSNLGILQETAKQLIRNLTDSNNIAVIHFNNMSHVIGDINNPFKPANETNKLNLTNEIEGLVTSGLKNLYIALNTSFDILDQFIAQGSCQNAIIVLTGGDTKFTGDTFSEDDIINLVTTRLNDTSYKIGGNSSIPFFIYSIGGDDSDTDLFYQKLACQQIAGFWSKIENENMIISRLSAYRQLFAYGSFEGPQNVSWSDAYTFAFGGVNGSTVFTPVFDNSTSPPRLLGVAGMNLSVKAMKIVLKDEADEGRNSWNDILSTRQKYAQPKCENLMFNRSQFETFRSFVSTDSICTTNFTPKAASDCPVEDYGFNLFTSNTTNDPAYCCNPSKTEVSTSCDTPPPPSDTSNANKTNIILLSVFLGVLLPVCVFALWFTKNRRKSLPAEDTQVIQPFNEQMSTHEADENQPFPTTEDPVTPYSSSSFSQSQGGTTGNSSFTGSSSFIQSQVVTTGYPPFICEGPRSPSPEEHVVIVYADPVH